MPISSNLNTPKRADIITVDHELDNNYKVIPFLLGVDNIGP